MRPAEANLRIGGLLDRRFARLRGEMERSKERSLYEVARLLDAAGVPYALIGGVAVQIWSAEPRTTLDIDVAVDSYEALPSEQMRRAGFEHTGRFEHFDNWRGPDGATVQFTDAPAMAGAIRDAERHALSDVSLRVAPVVELVRAKLRASADTARRRSKRVMDLADALALALGEQVPEALAKLDPAERRRLEE
jgi:hypothetical protein